MSEYQDKGAIWPSGLKHVLKQGMKILGVSVNWKWDRLVTLLTCPRIHLLLFRMGSLIPKDKEVQTLS